MQLVLIAFVLTVAAIKFATASHFYGGNIRFQATGDISVDFTWSMGWRIQRGPCGTSCTTSRVGTYGSTNMGPWECTNGCSSRISIASTSYTITAIDINLWEMGKEDFSYTFPQAGQYEISFEGNAWRSLNFGSNGNFALRTKFWLGSRSDIGTANNAPISNNLPIYTMQQGCSPGAATTITIPMLDSNGDTVSCRWATGNECESVCNSLPNTTLSNVAGNCVLTVDTSTSFYVNNGWYAVAITVEDFANSAITVGSQSINTNTPLSSTPVQFMVNTQSFASSCTAVPSFNTPTNAANDVVNVMYNTALQIKIYAKTADYPTSSITSIAVSGPTSITLSPSTGVAADDVSSRSDTKMITINWTPVQSDAGSHSLCFLATGSDGKASEFRCISIIVHLYSTTTSITTSVTTSRTTSVTTSMRTSVTTSMTTSVTTSFTTSATTAQSAGGAQALSAAGSPAMLGAGAGLAAVAAVSAAVIGALLLIRRKQQKEKVLDSQFIKPTPPAATTMKPPTR